MRNTCVDSLGFTADPEPGNRHRVDAAHRGVLVDGGEIFGPTRHVLSILPYSSKALTAVHRPAHSPVLWILLDTDETGRHCQSASVWPLWAKDIRFSALVQHVGETLSLFTRCSLLAALSPVITAIPQKAQGILLLSPPPRTPTHVRVSFIGSCGTVSHAAQRLQCYRPSLSARLHLSSTCGQMNHRLAPALHTGVCRVSCCGEYSTQRRLIIVKFRLRLW